MMGKILGLVIKYWFIIRIIIEFIEDVSGPDVTGEQKKAFVMEAVTALFQDFGIVLNDKATEAIGALINVLVWMLNKTGLFGSSKDATGELDQTKVVDATREAMLKRMPEADVNAKLDALMPALESIG